MGLLRAVQRLVSQSMIHVKEVEKAKWIGCDKSAGQVF